ncbi:MAG: hypothetical protein F4089_03810 [Gammaproteobacteria bacterium]|nr:hypothetical protein [Gammaproteobacteria bacterium]MYJ74267.1 hypothetical protein [Gammaproteobacteria bacterium]
MTTRDFLEDLGGDATDGLEGGDVAAQHGLQILAGAEPGPTASGCGRGPGRTASRADPVRLVVDDGLEVGEVDLGLLAGRGLEAAKPVRSVGRTSCRKSVTVV